MPRGRILLRGIVVAHSAAIVARDGPTGARCANDPIGPTWVQIVAISKTYPGRNFFKSQMLTQMKSKTLL